MAIAENSVYGIVVMDEVGYCLYANRAWQEITGYSIEDMASKPVHDWVHHHYPDGRPFPIEHCPIGCRLGRNQTVRNHRDLFFKKDGTPFHVSCAASPIANENAPALMILEIRDISEEIEADQRKEDFLAMLAHELRNPLAPIAAAAQVLQIAKLDDARVRHTSQIIGRQVSHMTDLVNDLLDVSRVTRGLIELEKAPLDIRQVIADSVEQVTPKIQARRHYLATHMSPDAMIVVGDQKRLVQVVTNILNNAAKYTPEGGNILLTTAVHESDVTIEVVDDGIGMAPELVTRVFELFSQAERTSDRSAGGLGLGLALAKNLIELHCGTVSCESEGIGKGSRFTVRLPRLVRKKHPDELNDSATSTEQKAKSLRVLVVDDNMDAATMLAMLLEASGHQVMVEHGAWRALERAATEAPEVCLVDIGLPEMNGNELARRLRAQPETAMSRLIAVTGYGQESDRKKALAAGFDHHLVKPVDSKELNAILARIKGR